MFEKLQLSTTELEVACARWGMRINVDKCKVLSENDGQVYIAGAAVEKVNNFVFLGSVVPGTSGDVKSCPGIFSFREAKKVRMEQEGGLPEAESQNFRMLD